jgi:hypothetical protein
MKKSKIYSAIVNSTFTQIKAYKKANAIARFKQLDPTVTSKDVIILNIQNSHQVSVENLYPEICK